MQGRVKANALTLNQLLSWFTQSKDQQSTKEESKEEYLEWGDETLNDEILIYRTKFTWKPAGLDSMVASVERSKKIKTGEERKKILEAK